MFLFFIRATITTVLLSIAPACAQGLPDALQAAVRNNPAVLGRQAERSSSDFRVEEAQARRYPSVSLEANGLNNTSTRGQVVVRQPVWAFGKIDGAIDLARARAEQSRARLLQTSRQILEDTAVVYGQILGLQSRQEAAERNVEEHRRLLEMISRRYRGGIASAADERLASSRLLSATATLEQIQGSLAAAQQEFHALTRTQPRRFDPVPTSLTALPAVDILQREAEDQDAGILLGRVALEVARRGVEQAKADMRPTLYAQVERDLGSRQSQSSPATRVGLVLSAQLDGMGFAGARRVQAEAELIAAADQDLEGARIEARRRVGTLFTDRQTQASLVLAQEQASVAVAETLASYLRQFDAGRKSWLDVLNTQRELADTRQQLEIARSAWTQHSLRLNALVGRLDELAQLHP